MPSAHDTGGTIQRCHFCTAAYGAMRLSLQPFIVNEIGTGTVPPREALSLEED